MTTQIGDWIAFVHAASAGCPRLQRLGIVKAIGVEEVCVESHGTGLLLVPLEAIREVRREAVTPPKKKREATP